MGRETLGVCWSSERRLKCRDMLDRRWFRTQSKTPRVY